ncbi:MAG: hypothetical protein JO334_03370 [Verrucomicrobia bacterium]|nr:hypothetical protein [Verrucomicrobiota bacterium]
MNNFSTENCGGCRFLGDASPTLAIKKRLLLALAWLIAIAPLPGQTLPTPPVTAEGFTMGAIAIPFEADLLEGTWSAVTCYNDKENRWGYSGKVTISKDENGVARQI